MTKADISDKNYEHTIRETYSKDSMHVVRVIQYDYMDRTYICSNEHKILEAQIFTYADLNIGQYVSVVIKKIIPEGLIVKVDNLYGFIPIYHVSEGVTTFSNMSSLFSVDQNLKARVIIFDEETNELKLTIKPSLMDPKFNILSKYTQAEPNMQVIGCIVKIFSKGVVAAFFGGVTGFIPTSELNLEKGNDPNVMFFIGQMIKCKVLKSIPKYKNLILTCSERTIETMDPGSTTFLTDHPTLVNLLLETYNEGHARKNNLHNKPIRMPNRKGYLPTELLKWKDIEPDCIFKGQIQDITHDSVMLSCPIVDYKQLLVVYKTDLCDNDIRRIDSLNLVNQQALYLRVLSIDHENLKLQCSAKLSKVWNFDLQPGIGLLSSYVEDIERIQNYWQNIKRPLAMLRLGQTVNGTVIRFLNNSSKSVVLELFNGVEAVVQELHSIDNINVGDKIECVIMWLDFVHNCAEVTINPIFKSKIDENQDNKLNKNVSLEVSVSGQILIVRPDFAIAVLHCEAGSGLLALLPVRWHTNDLNVNPKCYTPGKKYNMTVKMIQNSFIICVRDIDIVKFNEMRMQMLEDKSNISEEIQKKEANDSIVSKDNEKAKRKHKQKSDTTTEYPLAKKSKTCVPANLDITMPGANDFWNLNADLLKTHPKVPDSSSSEDDEPKQDKKSKKTKKLTAAEKFKQARNEEARVRSTEEALLNADEDPKNADHFDRLLLGNPNSSIIWINYMAFHLQATEIEKAKAVARKALATISFREEQEKLNVWIALLNLENSYGTKESFMETLEEASRMNDSLTVYTNALYILADSSKTNELIEMVNLVVRRFKANTDSWVNAATACFKAGLEEKARQLMQRAITGLKNKQHVDLIVRFAAMENRHGFPDLAQTLFEHVLTSYPYRVDVWIHYIDMLKKGGQIAVARQVLERSVSQKLPVKKMKILFKKFLDFETVHGDESTVKKVQLMADEYVQKVLNI